MLKGIVQVTGETGVGKTSLALGRPDVKPNEIAIYNFDVKPYPRLGDGKNRGYKFYGSYLHILQDVTNTKPEVALVEAVLEDFKQAKGAKVVILDSWEIFAKSWTVYFMTKPDRYKQTIGGGTYAQMSRLGHAPKVEVAMLDKLLSEYEVETIFVINHLANEYESPTGSDKGVKTGRKIPEASERLEQKASARFWLKHNQEHSCPICVVLKDPGIHKFEPKRGIVPYRMFPDRLTPQALGEGNYEEKNVSLWDIIGHYADNPVGARLLHDYEKATVEEFAMMAGSLTESQKSVWEANQRLALLLGDDYNSDLLDTIKEGKDAGKTAVEIFNEVKDTGVSLATVMKTYGAV